MHIFITKQPRKGNPMAGKGKVAHKTVTQQSAQPTGPKRKRIMVVSGSGKKHFAWEDEYNANKSS